MIIQDDCSSKSFFTQLPNIVFRLGLTGNEFLVYSELKRIAGEAGSCWQCKKTLAQSCGLAESSIQKIKKSLSKPRDILNGKSLISIEMRFTELGDRDTDLITIVDIWAESAEHFIKIKNGGGLKSNPGVGLNLTQGGLKFTPKEEPLKEDPRKNNNGKGSCSLSFSHLSLEILERMSDLKLQNITVNRMSKYTEEEIITAIRCYEEAKNVDSIDAFLISALKEKWQPSVMSSTTVEDETENERLSHKLEASCSKWKHKFVPCYKKLEITCGNNVTELPFWQPKELFKESVRKLLEKEGIKWKD